MRKSLLSVVLVAFVMTGIQPLLAEARPPHHARAHGFHQNNQFWGGNTRGWQGTRGAHRQHRRHRNEGFGTRVLKGGLIGAGVGAGSAVILDRPVGKSAAVGGAVGAGVEAVRHSRW